MIQNRLTLSLFGFILTPAKEINMTKKQFIWLVIRFIGFGYLFMAVQAILLLGFCICDLIRYYPYDKASSYLASYSLLDLAAASAATIVITAYMLFFGKFVYRVIDKSTSFVAECDLDTRNYAEIMIRFIGLYFLWWILAKLCIALYSTIMLIRFKHAPQEIVQLVSKNEMLSQQFKNLQKNVDANVLIGIIILAGLAFYFLKHGKLVIDLFHHRWLPGETRQSIEAPVSESTE
jgi:hypothetical protein